MKTKVRIFLVLAICGVLALPNAASAVLVDNVLVNGEFYEPGKYKLDFSLNPNVRYVELEVVNGEDSGKNKVSGVKIYLRDGKKKVVVISPHRHGDKRFSNARATLGDDVINGRTELSLHMKIKDSKKKKKSGRYGKDYIEVAGDSDKDKYHSKRWFKAKKLKKNGITLYVKEFYESSSVPPPPPPPDRPPGW